MTYEETKQGALAEAECPAEMWWELAAQYPLEAMQSVLFPLLTLEAPERWAQLELDNAPEWARKATLRLANVPRDLLACDCLERALPIFENVWTKDERPRAALRARRYFAGNTSPFMPQPLREALGAAEQAGYDAGWGAQGGCVAMVAWASGQYTAYNTIRLSAKAIAQHAIQGFDHRSVTNNTIADTAWKVESLWQYKQALHYLHLTGETHATAT